MSNSTLLVTIIAALLGGGGIAALIQIVLLPRTMARTRADTTQVLVGTATETVALVRGELARSQGEIQELRSKLAEERGRILEQSEQIDEQHRKIVAQDRKITDQDDRIRLLVAETEQLREQVSLLESRVRAATESIDGMDGGPQT